MRKIPQQGIRAFCLALFSLLFSTAIMAQQSVSGTVTDAEGEFMIGVTVVEQGTSNGTVTDIDGQYGLELLGESDGNLVFSYTGYEPLVVAVEGRSQVDVVLSAGISLDEVVVVGYGTQKKSNLTGAVSSVSEEALTTVPVANTSQALSGRVPGLHTKQGSSLPGEDGLDLSIRGFGNPLILVDGIQMDLGAIDPNDIESVSVLKDASAAIYGARAGNGVILVTTKRGGDKAPVISYHGNITWQEATAFPDRVGAGKWAELRREAELNLGLDPEFSEEEVQKYLDGTELGYQSYDWTDALIDNFAPMQQHNVSVSGGSEKVKYFSSLGYTDQASIFASDDFSYQRFNARSNFDVSITESIGFAIDLSYRKEQLDRSDANTNRIWNDLNTAAPIFPPSLPDPERVAYSGFNERNPVAQSRSDRRGTWNSDFETFTGRLEGRYHIPFIPGLTLKGVVNVLSVNTFNKQLTTPFDVWEYDQVNDEYILRSSFGSGTVTLNEEFIRESQLYPIISLEYGKTFGNHDLKGLLLAESIEDFENEFSAFRRDLISAQVPQLFAGGDVNVDNYGTGSEQGRRSLVGRINYAYKDRYLFEATFRYDANVQFAPDSRWGFFPSFSAAWRMAEEPWFNSSFIDALKFRASYSQLGNDRFATGYDYLTGFGIQDSKGHLFGTQVNRQIRTLGLPNENLTWETMTIWNAGINLSMWQGRFVLEADVFYRKREDMLATPQASLPSTFGANLPLTNLNSQDTRGVDLMLSYNNNFNGLRLTVSPIVSYFRSKWLHFEEEVYEDPAEQEIFQNTGQWVNRSVGYVSDGLFMSQQEIEALDYDQDQNGNTSLRPGDIRYVDLNNDGVINFLDQREIGRGGFPELTYSLNLALGWKGLRLDMLFQGASQYNINITGASRVTFANNSIPQQFHYDYRWQPDPNDPTRNINPDAQLPAASMDIHANNNLFSDFWLKDGTYVRLKFVNLSYDLPKSLLQNIGLQRSGLQFYAAATNLLTFTKLDFYENSFDPEGPQGKGSRNYPLHRNYTFGLRLTL